MAGHRIAMTAVLFAALWLLGCNRDPLGRYAISGSVTVDGAPLANGNISFQPTESQPTSSGAVVSDGKFSIPRDSGLVAGEYRVVVNAAVPGSEGKAIPVDAQPGDPPPPARELIPPDWNVSSQHIIEVMPEGPFEFPFEIATKGK
ncbi:MAG: carboxypeptidase regulatory-like domain-containing protein [Planctomycetes bacterium]|nr:carboxypeptidase regulatory-like domain-containing protein [Planctomycetota bacterium]